MLMTLFDRLSDDMLVVGQIYPGDIETAKAQNVGLIVNNRPDGEEPDEPQSAEIEAAARAAGIDFLYLPINHAGFSSSQIDTLAKAIEHADRPILAYCRSGTRSSRLWALAQAKLGHNPEAIFQAALAGGHNVSPVRPMMDMIASA